MEKKINLRLRYEPDADLLYLRFGDRPPIGARDVPGLSDVEAEYDEHDHLVGYMIYGFSKRPQVTRELKLPFLEKGVVRVRYKEKR